MATPPLITEISDTYPNPTDAVARVGFAKLYNYVKDLLGSTGNQAEALVAIGERTGATGTKTMPSGTTAQRSNSIGQRYNTTTSEWEGFNGTAWYPLHPAPLNYITGLNFSIGTGSGTFSITDGQASSKETPRVIMQAPGASTSKTMANWVVGTGNGGKSTAAAVAAFTTYHVFMIRRPDTGVVDFCFSTNITISANDYTTGGGNLPTAYTQSRRVLSVRTGSGTTAWIPMNSEDGNVLYTYAETLTNTSTSTSTTTVTISVPSLPILKAYMLGTYVSATTASKVFIISLTEQASSFVSSGYQAVAQSATTPVCLSGAFVMSEAGSIRFASDSNGTLQYAVTGYYDFRT